MGQDLFPNDKVSTARDPNKIKLKIKNASLPFLQGVTIPEMAQLLNPYMNSRLINSTPIHPSLLLSALHHPHGAKENNSLPPTKQLSPFPRN